MHFPIISMWPTRLHHHRYNYEVKSYSLGNDQQTFSKITIKSKKAYSKAQKAAGSTAVHEGKSVEVSSPDGHKFLVINEDIAGPNPITEVAVNVEDLGRSLGKAFTIRSRRPHRVLTSLHLFICYPSSSLLV